jgi:hypothetical protein
MMEVDVQRRQRQRGIHTLTQTRSLRTINGGIIRQLDKSSAELMLSVLAADVASRVKFQFLNGDAVGNSFTVRVVQPYDLESPCFEHQVLKARSDKLSLVRVLGTPDGMVAFLASGNCAAERNVLCWLTQGYQV